MFGNIDVELALAFEMSIVQRQQHFLSTHSLSLSLYMYIYISFFCIEMRRSFSLLRHSITGAFMVNIPPGCCKMLQLGIFVFTDIHWDDNLDE